MRRVERATRLTPLRQVREKEAETARKQAMIEAQKQADVSRIDMERRLQEQVRAGVLCRVAAGSHGRAATGNAAHHRRAEG